MKIRIAAVLLTGIFASTFTSHAQDIWKGFEHLFTPANSYVIYQTAAEIIIDGQPGERDWGKADWSQFFNDIEGNRKPGPLYKTRMKMLWDHSHLFILAELEEPHIWAYYDKNDMIVYHENDFEVFIDPDRDTRNYYEFELNAQNTLFDLFMDKPYRDGGKANITWNAKGFKSAVHLEGTLNNTEDEDKKWTLEIAIPFSSLTTGEGFIQPKNGSVWKINFSRVQWQTEISEGKYVKKINPDNNRHFPENNWVWSPQGVINMHYPERWSMAQFSEKPPGSEKDVFRLPHEEVFAKYIWLIYYKQKKFRSESGKYSPAISQLKMPKTGIENDISFQLDLKGDSHTFEATLKTEDGLIISVNQEGFFKVIAK